MTAHGRAVIVAMPFLRCSQAWRRRPASSHTTMKTTAAIRPVIKNVLNTAENQPMAVKISHAERIAPRTAPIIRPMAPIIRTRCPVQAVVLTGTLAAA